MVTSYRCDKDKMTISQTKETIAENKQGLEAAARKANTTQKKHNAAMSRLFAEANAIQAQVQENEMKHVQWEARHATRQHALQKRSKTVHNTTLDSSLGDRVVNFAVVPSASEEVAGTYEVIQ